MTPVPHSSVIYFLLQKSSLGKGISHGVNGSVDTERCVNSPTFERLRT